MGRVKLGPTSPAEAAAFVYTYHGPYPSLLCITCVNCYITGLLPSPLCIPCVNCHITGLLPSLLCIPCVNCSPVPQESFHFTFFIDSQRSANIQKLFKMSHVCDLNAYSPRSLNSRLCSLTSGLMNFVKHNGICIYLSTHMCYVARDNILKNTLNIKFD